MTGIASWMRRGTIIEYTNRWDDSRRERVTIEKVDAFVHLDGRPTELQGLMARTADGQYRNIHSDELDDATVIEVGPEVAAKPQPTESLMERRARIAAERAAKAGE